MAAENVRVVGLAGHLALWVGLEGRFGGGSAGREGLRGELGGVIGWADFDADLMLKRERC